VGFAPTPEQARAISSLSGQLCISAGAGSGKTRVLAERLAAAVDPTAGVEGWEPIGVGQALIVTFTDKAAGEIAERVRRVLLEHGLVDQARRVDEAWISTIHSLCTRLLRSHALEAGLDPSFSVIATVDARALREEVMERLLRDQLAEGRALDLVATYGVVAVVDQAGDVFDRLRAMGASCDDVRMEPCEDARTVLAEAIKIVPGWARCLAEHPSQGQTMQDNTAAAVAAGDALLILAERGPSEETEIAREVLRILHGIRLANRVPSARELVADCLDQRADLLDRAVRALTVPIASELVALVAQFGERYAAAKAERGVLDFEDLQMRAVELLRTERGPAARYRALFRLVMIDEFQDTNEVQTALADLLSDGTLCTVGDERQSIYGFRYADVDVYRTHTERMVADGAIEVSLASNFRSHGAVLDFVNAVFADEALFGGGFLRLQHGRDEAARAPLLPDGSPRAELVLVARSGRSVAGARRVEADAVARRLRELVDSGMPQGEMVVLLRAMTQADVYTAALSRHGLDFTVVAGGSFFGRPEVEAARSFLAVATNPRDDEALALLFASGMVGLSDDGLARLRRAAGRRALWETLEDAGLNGDDAAAALRAKAAIVTARTEAETRPVARILLAACEALDYDLYLLALGARGREAYANVLKLARLAEEHERAGGAGVRAFLEHLKLKERYRDREAPASVIDERADAVRVMTIHAAKGLEFPVVVVPELGGDLASDRGALLLEKDGAAARIALTLPDEDSSRAEERRSAWALEARERAKSRDLAEEKRLLYVACTRARELLVLSGSGDLAKPGGERPLGWLRKALGLEGGEIRTNTLETGGAVVRLTRLEEDEPMVEPPPSRERAADRKCEDPDLPHVTTRADTPISPPAFVSHSSMRLHEKCALRYFVEKVARVGDVAAPRERDPLRFGEAVHAALQLVGEGGRPPGEDRLDAIARRWRLAPDEALRLRGAVAGFLASSAGREACSIAAPAREVPFAVPLDHAVLVGKIDLMAATPDGVLIVDYKTGPGALEEGVGADYEMQADCYALAALSGAAERVRVTFVGVETGGGAAPLETSFSYSADDRPRLLAQANARASRLESGSYVALAGYDPYACADCPAVRIICPVKAPPATG
jgi:ATP-dependent helicase/nuclease subunit A